MSHLCENSAENILIAYYNMVPVETLGAVEKNLVKII